MGLHTQPLTEAPGSLSDSSISPPLQKGGAAAAFPLVRQNDATKSEEAVSQSAAGEQLSSQAFSLAQARALVSDLFVPRAWIYWTDFSLSTVLGCLAFWLIRRWEPLLGIPAPWSWLLGLFCYGLSVLLFYRAATFNHELVHLPRGTFGGFRLAWNLGFGIPSLMPSFAYWTHHAHHVRKLYATEADGEYLALACGPRWKILAFLLEAFVAPLVVVARSLFLTPLAYLSPAVRRFVNRRVSSMVIDPLYIRPNPSKREWRVWQLQELACVGCAWLVAWAWWTGYRGLFPPLFVPQAYAVAVGILLLNGVRTLAAHRYAFPRVEVSFVDQLLDSNNFPDRLWGSSLWAPVGMRFHALHHLFPTLPYHNMAEAHRRLMAGLPANSPYRQTEVPSLWTALCSLWNRAGRGASEPIGLTGSAHEGAR